MSKLGRFWKRGKKENEPVANSKQSPDESTKEFALMNEGNLYRLMLGQHAEAIKLYDKALEINPQYASAWYGKGISLFELGRFDEAIKCHDRALEITPQQADFWFQKGVAQDSLGLAKDTVASFRKFIELAPAQHSPIMDRCLEHAHQRLRELEGS